MSKSLEAAKGVEYLHSYVFPPIIHRDIKSSNILLDAQWNARVSDFGLSTHGPIESSHLSLMAAGTLGYMDPEYFRCQHLTIKSDVYSFGVLMMEVITGKDPVDHDRPTGEVTTIFLFLWNQLMQLYSRECIVFPPYLIHLWNSPP